MKEDRGKGEEKKKTGQHLREDDVSGELVTDLERHCEQAFWIAGPRGRYSRYVRYVRYVRYSRYSRYSRDSGRVLSDGGGGGQDFYKAAWR